MPIFPGNPGYRVDNDTYRTNLKLVISEGSSPSEDFLTDPYLPVLFTNPYHGSYYRPGEVQVSKGTIVGVRASDVGDPGTDLSVMKDYYQGKLRTVLTIANGGTDATDSNGHVRYANVPCGVAPYNYYRHINDRFYGNYPSIITREYIELPYITSLTLGAAMKWGCVVSDGVTGANKLRAGNFCMSDANGHFVKWDGTAYTQVVSHILAVDTSIPVQGWLQWVMWDMAQAAFNPAQKAAFNPYDLNQPRPTPDTGSDVFDKSDLVAGDFTKHFMPDTPDNYGSDSLYRWPEQLWDAMGIPGLTDGQRMAAVDYTEVPAADHKSINATTNVLTIQLLHTRIPKDEQGGVAPTADHPFPSKLLLYKNGATTPLSENIDYKVDRYRGIIYLLSGTQSNPTNVTGDTYSVTYTSQENQIIGVPTNWDFRGSIGGVRMKLKL